MLLHVVGSGELLVASRELAVNRLFSCVDLGMARSVPRGSKGLFASMNLTVAAGIPLNGALGNTRRSGAVLFARGRGTESPIGSALSGRALSVLVPEDVVGSAHHSVVVVTRRRQGRNDIAKLGIKRV